MPTATAPRTTAPQLTPLGTRETATTYIGGPDSGKTSTQTWAAQSADGMWTYLRLEIPGTPWEIHHAPTGYTFAMSSLRKAREWTATHGVAAVRARAERVLLEGALNGLGSQLVGDAIAEVARARQALAILDGTLLATGSTPEHQCVNCSGLLYPTTRLGALHVNGCADCWSPTEGWQPGRCPQAQDHTWCAKPEPVMCDHARCASDMRLDAPVCAKGLDNCCGCCQDDELYTDGK